LISLAFTVLFARSFISQSH